jgi:hypothetical protein
MIRHYTFSDLHHLTMITNETLDATDSGDTLSLSPASKKLILRNDSPNDIYMEFEGKAPGTATSLRLKATDNLVALDEVTTEIGAICAAGETAKLRVGVCR